MLTSEGTTRACCKHKIIFDILAITIHTKLSFERILNANHCLKYVVTNVVCNAVLDGKFSNITGSLGITKFQVGAHSVLASERTLSGICKWRLRHAVIKHEDYNFSLCIESKFNLLYCISNLSIIHVIEDP